MVSARSSPKVVIQKLTRSETLRDWCNATIMEATIQTKVTTPTTCKTSGLRMPRTNRTAGALANPVVRSI